MTRLKRSDRHTTGSDPRFPAITPWRVHTLCFFVNLPKHPTKLRKFWYVVETLLDLQKKAPLIQNIKCTVALLEWGIATGISDMKQKLWCLTQFVYLFKWREHLRGVRWGIFLWSVIVLAECLWFSCYTLWNAPCTSMRRINSEILKNLHRFSGRFCLLTKHLLCYLWSSHQMKLSWLFNHNIFPNIDWTRVVAVVGCI